MRELEIMVGIKTEMRKACNLDGYKEAFVTKTDDKTPIFDYREARPTLFDAVQVRPPILVYFLLRCCLGFERRTKMDGMGFLDFWLPPFTLSMLFLALLASFDRHGLMFWSFPTSTPSSSG